MLSKSQTQSNDWFQQIDGEWLVQRARGRARRKEGRGQCQWFLGARKLQGLALRAVCPHFPAGRKIPPDVLRIKWEVGGCLPCSRAGRNRGWNRELALDAPRGVWIRVDSEGQAQVFLDILTTTCDRRRGSETAPRFGSGQLEG